MARESLCVIDEAEHSALQTAGIQVIDCELARRDEPSRLSAAYFAQLLLSRC
jgi:hypothetical protein